MFQPRLTAKSRSIFLVLLAVTSCAVCSAQRLNDVQKAVFAQRLINLLPNTVEALRTVEDLEALSPDDMHRVLADNWRALNNNDAKLYLLTTILQNDNDRVLDILDLGVEDSSLTVQNRALQFAENFGFESFTEDFASYQSWRRRSVGKPLRDVFQAGMKTVVSALPKADDGLRSTLLNILVRSNLSGASQTSRLRRDAAIDAGLMDVLVPFVKQQNNFMWTAFQIIRNAHPGDDFIRRVIIPLTDARIETAVRYQALSVLGMEQYAWATDHLVKMMIAEYPEPSAEVIAQTLGQIGDPRIIPTFISLMEADNTPEGNRVLGNILSPLTGVNNGIVRDAAWWRAWWQRNSGRFPAEVQAQPFPKLAVRARPVQPQGQLGLVEPPRPTLRQIASDPKRAYWFIDPRIKNNRLSQVGGRRLLSPLVLSAIVKVDKPGEQPPPPPIGNPAGVAGEGRNSHVNDAPGLIVVLTSDGDAASAAGFWLDVAVRALERKYCVAVVVAPKWSDAQQMVWISGMELKAVKEAKFSTETLLTDIVKDVTATTTLDSNRVYLHGIGAGGAATYAASLEEKTPFHGFYILAATFKSASMPPLDRASGRRYLIQNGKEDKVHPYWMAEAAQKLLTQKGAVVKLDASPGYLGSQPTDAVMAQIKSSFDWIAVGK